MRFHQPARINAWAVVSFDVSARAQERVEAFARNLYSNMKNLGEWTISQVFQSSLTAVLGQV